MISLTEAENFEYPEKDIGKPLKNITLSEADSIESYEFKPFEYERGSVTKFATGVVNTIRDMQDMPEQLQIFGNRLSFGFGGYFGDTPEETERKRLNLVTAERNLDAAQRERYQFTSGKEQESIAYGVGGGVVSYGSMLVSGGVAGGAAKALGASAKVAGALTEAAGITTMGTMELAGAVQDKTKRTEQGEIDIEAMTPEWARNATGGTVAYTALSAITEKYVGFGRQLKMWEKPVQWGNKVTSNVLTAMRAGIKNAISEGATEGLQDLEATGIGLIDGTVRFDELPARIQQAWKSAIIGGIIGDGVGTAVAIKSGRNVRKQLRDMVYPVVGDMNEAQSIAEAMYNAGTDELTQMMSVELELSSELKNKHGKVWNSMLSAIDKAIADSNSPQFANMTEDQRAEYANTAAKHFADQVLAEANKRGTTIDSIISDTDITYDNGIRLARHINMFDALKNPEMIPSETKLKRTSLTQFLRSRGGLLDVGGDLKSMDAIKGMPGLISKKGVGLDDAALSAWEHGYFPEFSERPSVNDLLEAIDEELRGNKRYNIDEQLTFSDQLSMLEENLDREGIDWRNMSPAEIEQAVNDIPELQRLEREVAFYENFEPDIDYNMTGLTEDERDAILERQGMQLYQMSEKEIKKHKKQQLDIILRENPMEDDYHVGIRKLEDIKTFEETLDDEESFVWGDYSREDAEADLERGLVTVYSSYPIKDGVFVSTSYTQANEYAGRSGKVYKKTVSPDKIAWINGDEGQFADVTPEVPYQVSDSFFYQRGRKEAKGVTKITPDAYIINLMENADESTLPHEFAHYWLDNMWNYVRSGRASESYMNRWNTIADYLGVNPDQTRLSRGQQEKFASSYEAYLTKGDLPTPAIQSAFDDYDKWLQRVYNDYNKINYQSGYGRRRVRLTDAAVKFFQSMTSGGLEAPALAPVDTGVRLEALRAPEVVSDNAVVEVPTVVDSTRVVNITEGEKGVSKVFQREGMINADRIVDELGVDYHKINLEDQAIKATEWVRNNLEEARKVVNGAPAPEGIIDTAIFIAYENEMLRIGNNAEYTRALKIHSQVQTQRGQAIAAERIATNNMTTPAYWLEKVINNREQGLADRLFKGDVKKLRNLITDETKKAAKEVLGKSREEQRKYLQKLADRLRKENNVDTLYQLPDEELDKDNVMNVIHNFLEEAMGVTVTQEESDALINKAEQLKKVWDNTLDKNGNPSVEGWRTLAEMNKTVEAMSPSHIMTVMSSIYGRSAMLASVKSPTLNIMSNLQNFITEGIVRRFTMGKDKSVNKDAIKEYMKYSWETYNASGFIVSGMQDVSEEIVTLGESRPTTQGRGKLRKIAQVSENIVFKYLMGAPDAVAKDLNFVDTADLLATKIAKDEGAKDISDRSTEIFQDAILINPTTEQGKQVRAQAIEQAHIATYTNNSKISDFSLKARQWLNMIGGNKFKLGDVVMPFVKTPANVQMMGLEYGFGSLYTLYKIGDIMRNPASEVSQRAIKAAYRNGVGLFLAMMIAAAFDPDDYIPEFDNATTKDRELAKAKNAPFNSIKIGNKWVSLDYFGPLGIPLVAVLNARKGRNLTDQITNFVKAGISQGMKIPGIKEGLAIWDSLSRTAAYSTTPEKAFDMVSNALLDQVRARTIPAIVNDVAKIMDEYERDTSGSVLDKVQASIPLLREKLPQRYTISGKPLKTEGAASILFFGGRVKTAEDNKLVKEINKLSKKEEQPSISDVTRYGDLRLLSPEKKIKARRDFYKEYAKESKKLISSRSYKKLDAGDKKKALDKIRRNIVKDLKEKYAKDIKREKRRR